MKKFHVGTLVSITDGHLIAPNLINDVYDILNYMTGDDLYTHALIRAGGECKPYLFEQFPWLREVTAPDNIKECWQQWRDELVAKYGEWHEVRPIHSEDHEVLDPIEEAKRMGLGDKLIAIDLTEDEPPSPYGDIDWKVPKFQSGDRVFIRKPILANEDIYGIVVDGNNGWYTIETDKLGIYSDIPESYLELANG